MTYIKIIVNFLGLRCTPLLFAIVVTLAVCSQSRSQTVLGARSLGLGESSAALTGNVWSVFANPAMMDTTRSVAFYGVRNFGFTELTDISAATVIPTSFGVGGIGLHRFGDDLFSENRFRLAYKNSFMGFHYGGVINYTSNSIEGYGSDGALGVDVGLAAQPLDGLWIGGVATNVNQPTLGEEGEGEGEELIRTLAFGLSYKILDRALFTSDVVKDVRFPASYRGGLEIYIIEGLTGRVGVTTEPTTFTFGMGYETRNWGINLAVQKHQILDLSPGVDLKVNW